MTSRDEPRLADAAEIAAEHGLTPARISGLYTNRTPSATGTPFPETAGQRGRARLWNHAEVTAWFADRGQARLRSHTPPARDPQELLNAAEASRFLGYKNTNQVTTYVRDHPGYFPDPGLTEETGTASILCRTPADLQTWAKIRLVYWVSSIGRCNGLWSPPGVAGPSRVNLFGGVRQLSPWRTVAHPQRKTRATQLCVRL
ncbi:hypothetical protein [Streptomyces sp. NPDC093094]|uniref:hypothetical protein n=1 Tax=Streptomyces sp. NPDC093094 TaxID=3366026 RepID=UPI0037F3BD9D